VSRFLTRAAVIAATTALATGALAAAVAPAATAVATPALTLSTIGPFAGGESVTVSYTGFAAAENLEVAVCRKVATLGPTDCFPLGPGFSDTASAKVVVADGTGAGSASIEVVKGALGSTPAWTCGPGDGHGCDIVVSNFSGTSVAKFRIIYAGTAGSSTPSGPYAGGETVTLAYSGAAANQPLVALQCDTDSPIPGDGSNECDFTGMVPTNANVSGAGSVSIKIQRGALGNPLNSRCGNAAGDGCSIIVTDFSGRFWVAKPLVFKQVVTTTPKSPYTGAVSVDVAYDGFAANEMLAASICADRPLFGPGDCASATDSAKVVSANSMGAGTVTLKLITGALGNSTAPAWNCASGCSIVVSNFMGTKVAVKPIVIGKSQTLPAFPKSVKKGSKKVLPKASTQGVALTYKSLTPKICKVVTVKVAGKSRKAVKGIKLGSCRVSVANAGTATYFPVATVKKVRVKR
jgi:hypothetical protein